MSFYDKPWAPGYSLPPYLKSEDPLRSGSGRTTMQLPNGTFGPVPKGLKFGGYSQPQYLKDEPIGSHAITTPQLPDGTIPPIPANVLASGNPWSETTLQSNGLGSLGNDTLSSPTLPNGDPIQEYGDKAAQLVLEELSATPQGKREARLKEILDKVDPKLRGLLRKEMVRSKNVGKSQGEALKLGLARAFSKGITGEFIRLGKQQGKGKIKPKGQVALALAAYHGAHTTYHLEGVGYYGELGGITDFFKKLGSAACDVATNPLTPAAAGAASIAAGGDPTLGVTGAGIAAGACAAAGSGASQTVPFAPQQGTPGWVLPAVIGGGALLLVLALRS